jgi:hypothetical protein
MSDDELTSYANLEFEWDESDFVSQNEPSVEKVSANPPNKKQKLVLNSPTQQHIPTPEDQIYTYEDEDEFEQFEDFAQPQKAGGDVGDAYDEDMVEVREVGHEGSPEQLSRTQGIAWRDGVMLHASLCSIFFYSCLIVILFSFFVCIFSLTLRALGEVWAAEAGSPHPRACGHATHEEQIGRD